MVRIPEAARKSRDAPAMEMPAISGTENDDAASEKRRPWCFGRATGRSTCGTVRLGMRATAGAGAATTAGAGAATTAGAGAATTAGAGAARSA